MKKIVIIFLLIFPVSTAYSQSRTSIDQYPYEDDDPYAAQFGFKFGIGVSHLTHKAEGYGSIDYRSKTGFLFGTVIGARIKKNVMLQMELLYVNKGGSHDSDINIEDYKIILKYLEIPFLFKYCAEKGKKIRPNIYAGPVLSFIISSRLEGIWADGDITSVFSTADYGIGIGGGVDFIQKNNIIAFDVRFTLGFKDIYSEDDAGIVMNNSNLTVSATIYID